MRQSLLPLLVLLTLALAECGDRDYDGFFRDAGECADASSTDAGCEE